MSKVAYLTYPYQHLLELTGGPQVKDAAVRLEERIASHYGMRHALLVGDVHTALLAVALACDVRGHEVVVSPLEPRGVTALTLAGATLVPAVLRSTDLTIDAIWLDELVSPRTRMMVVPHTGGSAPDHEALCCKAEEHGLLVVGLGPLGALDEFGRAAGALAQVMVVDLAPAHGITAGQGAAIVTSNSALFDRIVSLCGSVPRQWHHLGDCHPANLHAPMQPLACHLLDATWDLQWHRMRARQQHYARLLRGLGDRFVTKPYRRAEASTYTGVRLCAHVGRERDRPMKCLRYVFNEPQPYGLPVLWRIPRMAASMLTALNTYRFAPLTEFEQEWQRS